jgi:hypothetical protein
MSHESWRDIKGWEGFYQVSSEGRVRSLDRTIAQRSRWGIQTRVFKSRILKPILCTNGYLCVDLSRPGTGRERLLIHRLVAFSFCGQPQEGHEVCHLNGTRADNRAVNLRWGSRASNHADKVLHGTDFRGVKNPQCKLSVQAVISIRRSNLRIKELAARYNVSETTISNIRTHKRWCAVEEAP